MQTKYKIIIYIVIAVLLYASGFFTHYGIARKRASQFSDDRLETIEGRSNEIRDGIDTISSYQLIINDGIKQSQERIDNSIRLINESTESNNKSIELVRTARDRLDSIQQRLNQLYDYE